MNRVLKILETVTSLRRQHTCEACGGEFICGVSLNGCWCSEIELTDEVRRDLRSRYTDCLCRQCLESLGLNREPKESAPEIPRTSKHSGENPS